jgi:hypothetical protein
MCVEFITPIFIEFIALSTGSFTIAIDNLCQPIVTTEIEWHSIGKINHYLNFALSRLFGTDRDRREVECQ